MKKLGYKTALHAFTLSEVLITLGIIGVVAAMTIPVLMEKYQEHAIITRLKRVYSILSQAYLFAVEEYDTPDGWGITARDSGSSDENEETYNAENAILIKNKLFEKVKTVQSCDNAKKQTYCGMADEYKYLNGTVDSAIGSRSSSKTTSLTTIDGTALQIIANSGSLVYRGTGALEETYAIIYVDLNGTKQPNIYGKDLFAFYLTGQNIMPVGTQNETSWSFKKCIEYGLGCTAWAISIGNLDYLKCSDLSWNGKHRC